MQKYIYTISESSSTKPLSESLTETFLPPLLGIGLGLPRNSKLRYQIAFYKANQVENFIYNNILVQCTYHDIVVECIVEGLCLVRVVFFRAFVGPLSL